MGFFVEPETVWVEFSGAWEGWKVLLKKEMDAGDQEALEDTMLIAEMDGGQGVKPILRQGTLKLLELNIIKIISPDGQEIQPTPERIRKLHRGVREILRKKIQELNRPLAELGA